MGYDTAQLPAPQDLTRDFTSKKVDWSLRGQRFVAQFPALAGIQVGIYAILTRNDDDRAVRDRNKHRKVMVHPRRGALKSGKFERCFCGRMRDYYRHFHRRNEDRTEQSGIFPDVLHLLLVVDLTATRAAGDKKLLRGVEKAWNRRVRAMLRDGQLNVPTQHGRSETRWLRGDPPSADEIRAEMQAVVEEFEDRLRAGHGGVGEAPPHP